MTAAAGDLLGTALRGAGVALAVAAPAALLAQVVDAATDGAGALTYLLALVVLAGMVVGGASVGRRTARLAPAALAGLGAMAVVQVLGVVRRLVAGEEVAWGSVPALTALGVALAVAGATLAARRAGRKRP